MHGPAAGSTGSHGPTANGTGSHGPSANGAGVANGHGPSANGARYSPAASGTAAHSAPIQAGGHNQAISRAAPAGSVDHATRNGSAIRTRQNGKVSDVHDARNGMDVHHGLNGNRRASMDRPDHSRIVSERGHPGFAQHPYQFRGHAFARRSYYYHGRAYDRFYHGYMYRGLYMDVYAPAFYYGPAFYGWAYNPWAAPIAFQWGWPGSFWFGYYGYYFAPEPSYPAAPLWLTDYMIASDLQQAYAARQEAGEFAGDPPPPAGGPPALTPAVKYMIAGEVKNQLAVENYEAQQNAAQLDVDPGSSGIARLLGDGHPHVFVSGGSLDLVEASGQECAISSGDALQMRTPPPDGATAANLVVLSSKGGQECPMSSLVSISLGDLQEMQNHMRESIDQGLQELQAKEGKGEVPMAPPSAQSQPVPALYASAAPPPDLNVAAEIQQQAIEADQAETEVATAAAQESLAPVVSTPAAPATIALGQIPDEVRAALGQPSKVADLGSGSMIYYYEGMKVIFKNGTVSSVK